MYSFQLHLKSLCTLSWLTDWIKFKGGVANETHCHSCVSFVFMCHFAFLFSCSGSCWGFVWWFSSCIFLLIATRELVILKCSSLNRRSLFTGSHLCQKWEVTCICSSVCQAWCSLWIPSSIFFLWRSLMSFGGDKGPWAAWSREVCFLGC